jgi:hypothetical protein
MLSDQGKSTPDAETCKQAYISPSTNRTDMGRSLLKWFLKDGKIRGVDADGQIYIHTIDPELVKRFIARLRTSL